MAPEHPIVQESREQAERNRTEYKLNNPSPGDRIPMDDNKDSYFYYDGGRWNKHEGYKPQRYNETPIWGEPDNMGSE